MRPSWVQALLFRPEAGGRWFPSPVSLPGLRAAQRSPGRVWCRLRAAPLIAIKAFEAWPCAPRSPGHPSRQRPATIMMAPGACPGASQSRGSAFLLWPTRIGRRLEDRLSRFLDCLDDRLRRCGQNCPGRLPVRSSAESSEGWWHQSLSPISLANSLATIPASRTHPRLW